MSMQLNCTEACELSIDADTCGIRLQRSIHESCLCFQLVLSPQGSTIVGAPICFLDWLPGRLLLGRACMALHNAESKLLLLSPLYLNTNKALLMLPQCSDHSIFCV